MLTAEQVKKLLKLQPLPVEGGFFAETYRSKDSTAIYYMLTPDAFSLRCTDCRATRSTTSIWAILWRCFYSSRTDRVKRFF